MPGFFNKYPYTDFHELNLDWIIESMKKLLDDYSVITDWIENDAANFDLLLGRIIQLENKTVNLQTQINNERLRVDNEFNAQYSRITSEYTTLYSNILLTVNAQLVDMNLTIEQYKRDLIQMINDGDTAVMSWVNATLQTFIENLPDYELLIVNNPVTGTQTTIQQALNDLYDYFNVWGLTAQEYDDLELTAAYYDSLAITARDYDTFGYKLLNPEASGNWMRSPITGQIEQVKDVIYELFDLHRVGALTATEYDALDLTADDYAALDLTAYDYDLNGIH